MASDAAASEVGELSNNPTTISNADSPALNFSSWLFMALQAHRGEPIHFNIDDLAAYFDDMTANEVRTKIERAQDEFPNLKIVATSNVNDPCAWTNTTVRTTDRDEGHPNPICKSVKSAWPASTVPKLAGKREVINKNVDPDSDGNTPKKATVIEAVDKDV